MGRRPGPEVNGERCISKPMNRPKGGTLALQDGEEVSYVKIYEDLNWAEEEPKNANRLFLVSRK